MGLRAGEVLPGRPEALGLDRPQVDLHPGPDPDAGLGIALCDDVLYLGQGRELPGDAIRVVARHQQVEVAHGLPGPAETACHLGPTDSRQGSQRRQDELRSPSPIPGPGPMRGRYSRAMVD